jgi:putative endonuclease
MQTDKQLTGANGEQQALAYLKKQGLRLVEANFSCKCGEIDLIMRDGDSLVFVEVRQRADRNHGGAAASISLAKQRRIVWAAQFYLQRHAVVPPCRIDVVAIDCGQLNWMRNAISAD